MEGRDRAVEPEHRDYDEDGNPEICLGPPKEEPDCSGCDNPECPEYGSFHHSDHEPGTIPAAPPITAGTVLNEESPF